MMGLVAYAIPGMFLYVWFLVGYSEAVKTEGERYRLNNEALGLFGWFVLHIILWPIMLALFIMSLVRKA